jgi:hypothetical protein
MRDILRDQLIAPRFDALVVDEAQDHDTCWPGSESGKTDSGWWEIYWKLLRQNTDAPMAVFYDQAQRPLFRQKERFEAARILKRLSQPAQANLLFTLRYSLPIFRFLKALKSEATTSLVENLRYRATLPEGPDVELHEVEPTQIAVRLQEVVTRWVGGGFCRLDEILILSPHGTKAKTSLANYVAIGDWPIVGIEDRASGNLSLISVNKAKGLDSLGVIMIDVDKFEALTTPQDRMNYFMGASRARQLLAILHQSTRLTRD